MARAGGRGDAERREVFLREKRRFTDALRLEGRFRKTLGYCAYPDEGTLTHGRLNATHVAFRQRDPALDDHQ